MSKFFSKRRFHLSSPSNLIHYFNSNTNTNSDSDSNSNYNNNSSKSSPCGNNLMTRGPFSPQSKKKLTRQGRIRKMTVEDYCAPVEDDGVRSKSLPNSPQQKQQHWSVSAVPQPLPLPNEELRFPAEGNGRSDRIGMKTKSRCVPIPAKTSTYSRRKGYPQEMNGDADIRLDVPARSAPATTFTSPTRSPKRFSTLDYFDSAFAGPHECHLSPSSEESKRQFHLHSPQLHSPYVNNNVGVHPLPLPLPPSQPVSRHHSLERSEQSIKGQWQKGKLLGRGTFGTVYEAANRETGSLCAMKEVDIIPDDPKSSECIRQLEQEIKVLRNLEHPNIVHYLGSEVVDNRFCIYLEYVHPGSLNKYVRDHCAAVTESVIRNFTRHILSGLAYLHSKKTVHRDIKGANLLVDSSGVVKLADFGLAKHLTTHITDLSLKGSPHWMAPEVLLEITIFLIILRVMKKVIISYFMQVLQAVMRKDSNPEHTFTMDIWSLGCTVIEMVTGKPPWSEFNGVQAMFNVLNRSPPIPETLSPEGKDFLSRCLQRNPEKRSSAAALLEHPFVRHSFDPNTLCKQDFSSLRLNEISYNPTDSPAHPKDTMQHSQGPWVKHGRLQFQCLTPKKTHSETKTDHSPATRHSPRSTLEVLPSVFSPGVKFSTRYSVPQAHKFLPVSAEHGRTYSLPTTPSRESYLL
ncbi:uncharacterized protein [Rutidosis leptorrhynchoides]|uniref:uncharacterized protein isoform X2 n=1 Tax=Rutidosis leptorrhynchoides TaxID=125765 RepID=UPI003A99760F